MGKDNKCSQKGLSKRNKFGKETWKSVLFDEDIVSGTNMGFRMIDGNMVKYSQLRSGLTSFYAKRKVLDDKVTTIPLDILYNMLHLNFVYMCIICKNIILKKIFDCSKM